MDKKEEPRIFKLWKCPICGDSFNHRVTEIEAVRGLIVCPNCYSEISVSVKKQQ